MICFVIYARILVLSLKCFFCFCLIFFRTIANLDYETFSEFRFQVNVRDSGQPSRSADSPAEVIIKVIKLLMKVF